MTITIRRAAKFHPEEHSIVKVLIRHKKAAGNDHYLTDQFRNVRINPKLENAIVIFFKQLKMLENLVMTIYFLFETSKHESA